MNSSSNSLQTTWTLSELKKSPRLTIYEHFTQIGVRHSYDFDLNGVEVLHFQGVDFSACPGIKDALVRANYSTVRHMDLTSAEVVDELLIELLEANCTWISMTSLDVSDTNITPETLHRLRASLAFYGPLLRLDGSGYADSSTAGMKTVTLKIIALDTSLDYLEDWEKDRLRRPSRGRPVHVMCDKTSGFQQGLFTIIVDM